MTPPTPPLRFLILVLGGWTAVRAGVLAPGWWATPPAVAQAPAATAPAPAEALTGHQGPVRLAGHRLPAHRTMARAKSRGGGSMLSPGVSAEAVRPVVAKFAMVPEGRAPTSLGTEGAGMTRPSPAADIPVAPTAAARRAPGRWSLSAWTFVRSAGAAPLAPGGTLGGGQSGLRASYALRRGRRPLLLSARLYAPHSRPAGAEASLGVDWKPSSRLPLRLLGERRQALGREGRSAFALTLHGGVSEARLGALRIDAYGQAGVVGARSRDLFAESSARLSLPLGRLRLGLGGWAAAQPGASRADVGPTASLRLPVAGRSVTATADWRLRIAGRAEPGSGPALTLATDF